MQSFSINLSKAGLIITGLGCAPIYPSLIHSTPELFGRGRSQSIIGIQMASAYLGNIVMPPLFGFLARFLGLPLFPYYLFLLLIIMAFMHEKLLKNAKGE
jgi:MFS family permease